MACVYELHLAIKSPSPDDERAKAIVAKLSEQRQVEYLDGSWWRTDYSDYEDHGAAVHALHADLRAIDAHWGEVLRRGLHEPPRRHAGTAFFSRRPRGNGAGRSAPS